MGLQYLEMMKQLGDGQSTKWIIPMDLASVAGNISSTLAGISGGARSVAQDDGSANGES